MVQQLAHATDEHDGSSSSGRQPSLGFQGARARASATSLPVRRAAPRLSSRPSFEQTGSRLRRSRPEGREAGRLPVQVTTKHELIIKGAGHHGAADATRVDATLCTRCCICSRQQLARGCRGDHPSPACLLVVVDRPLAIRRHRPWDSHFRARAAWR